MKIKLEDEVNPVTIMNVWKHFLEQDEEFDYTVDYINSEGQEKMRCISREEYLRICQIMKWEA